MPSRVSTPSSLQGIMLDAGASGGNDLAQAQSIGNLYAVGALAQLPTTLADTIVGAIPSEMDGLRKQQTMSGIMLDDARTRKTLAELADIERKQQAVTALQDHIRNGGDINGDYARSVLAAAAGVDASYMNPTSNALPVLRGFSDSDQVKLGASPAGLADAMAPVQLGMGKGWQDTRPGNLEDDAAAMQRTQAQQDGAMGRTRYSVGQTNARYQEGLQQNERQFQERQALEGTKAMVQEEGRMERATLKQNPESQKAIKIPNDVVKGAMARFENELAAVDYEQYAKSPVSLGSLDMFATVFKRYAAAGYPEDGAYQAAREYMTRQDADGHTYKSHAVSSGGALPSTPDPTIVKSALETNAQIKDPAKREEFKRRLMSMGINPSHIGIQ